MSAESIEQQLRKQFAECWLNQETQLRRLNFSPRQIHFSQRAAWLVFVALWKRLNPS